MCSCEDDGPEKKCPVCAPGWMLTFADLMSLLLAFFVLLFSFSEIDKKKFKEIAGSMKDAFGVQTEVQVRESPKGISLIAREFSPGRTEPTPLNQVRQVTSKDIERYAKLDAEEAKRIRHKELEDDMDKVKEKLKDEIALGMVEVENNGDQVIIIRIREKGSFPSGSATLSTAFDPVIDKIGELVREIPGSVVVAGHTDDRPISTVKFPSNWELSAARAATVLHRVVEASTEPNARFRMAGYADTRPLEPNDTPEGRARNRRVEVILLRGSASDHVMGASPGGDETSVISEELTDLQNDPDLEITTGTHQP